jgi:hypothetical protein
MAASPKLNAGETAANRTTTTVLNFPDVLLIFDRQAI